LSIEVGRLATEPGDVTVGVRPHDVEIVAAGTGDGTGRVEVVESLGAFAVVHLGTASRSEGLIRVVVAAGTRPAIGDLVGFRLRRDGLHFFEVGSGRRLDLS
jgi:ABC-type sugar transport system ATPase subunit